jgi:hypothetical protein
MLRSCSGDIAMNPPQRTSILDVSLRCLTHPFTWLAVAILLVNDHILKTLAPSWLTGKLSDFAGLFFFPFVLAALLSLPLDRLCVSPRRAGRLVILSTGLSFALLKLAPEINLLASEALSRVVGYRTTFSLDPTDLLALSMLLPAWWLWNRPAQVMQRRIGWMALAIGAAASLASSTPSPQLGIVGVQAGLPRFTLDCTHYQPFPPYQNGPVTAIEVAPDGKVWAGGDHAIARFDPADGSWQTFQLPVGNWQLGQLSIGPDNLPWATIRSGEKPYPSQLLRFAGQGFQRASEIEAVITSTINHVAFAPDRTMWIATNDGAYHWDESNKQWQHYDPSTGWTGRRVEEIRFTPDGTIWLAYDGTGTAYHKLPIESGDADNWNLRTTQEDNEPGSRTSYDEAYVSRDGRIWFSGQRFFDPVQKEWVKTVRSEAADSQAVDSSGRLWLVQRYGDHKAVLIPDPLSSLQEQWLYFGKAEGLASDKIISVAVAGDNMLWFGSGYGAEAGSVSRCKPPGDRPNSMTLAAYAGFGGGSSALSRFDSLDGGLTWSPNPAAESGGYSTPEVAVEPQPDVASLRDPNNDAIRFRVTRGQGVERSTDSGATWTTEIVLPPWTQAQEALYATRIGNYQASPLPTAAEIDRQTGNLILGMGLEGVLVKTPDGLWQWMGIDDYQHIEPRGVAILVKAVTSPVLLSELCASISLACFMFGLALLVWGNKKKTLKIALVLNALAFGLPLFRGLYAGSFLDMSMYVLCAQGLLIVAGLALLAASSEVWPVQPRIRRRFAVIVSILGMILYWIPYVLWTQNIIPERQTATVSALIIAAVMVVIQSSVARWLLRQQAALSNS